MNQEQCNKTAEAISRVIDSISMEEALDRAVVRQFVIDNLELDKAMRSFDPRKDFDRVERLMRYLLDSEAPGAQRPVLDELKELYDGMDEVGHPGTNSLTMATFGEAFCSALVMRTDPRRWAYHRAIEILGSAVETENLTEEQMSLLDDALQVGLKL